MNIENRRKLWEDKCTVSNDLLGLTVMRKYWFTMNQVCRSKVNTMAPIEIIGEDLLNITLYYGYNSL